MNSFICKRCGSHVIASTLNYINHIYKDNTIVTSEGSCRVCGCHFFYIYKSHTLDEAVFPYEDYGFCKRLKNISKIYTSYIPIPELVDENREIIKSIRKKDDVVIGFDGWEDIVINKKLAGGWYMTYNSPPILDVAVINCSNYCFGDPEIIMSYFPTPILIGKVKMLNNRDLSFFDSKRNVMLDEKRSFYIGIKEKK